MLGIVWYSFTLFAAFQFLVNNVYPRLTLVESMLAAVPLGTIGGAWIALMCACAFSEINDRSMGLATAIMAAYVVLTLQTFVSRLSVALNGLSAAKAGGHSEATGAVWTGLLVAVAGVLSYPLWDSHMLTTKEDGSVWTGGSCWADFPIHLHISNSMLHGRNKVMSFSSMHSPIFADRPMTYPYLPDFHAAALVWMGSSFRQVYFATGFLSFLALIGLVFSLGSRTTGSRVASLVGVVVLVFMGGVGGFNIYNKEGWDQLLTRDAIQDDYVNGEFRGGSIFWFAFLPHIFLPQRGATIAYPAVASVILIFWQAIRSSRSATQQAMPVAERRFLLVLCAVVSALLPLVQAHSFAGLAVFIAVVFVLDAHSWISDPRLIAQAWAPAGVVAGVIFLPQWLIFSRMVEGKSSFLAFTAVFRGQSDSAPQMVKDIIGSGTLFADFVWCWVRAIGPFLPLFFLVLAFMAPAVILRVVRAFAAALSSKADTDEGTKNLRDASMRLMSSTFPLDINDDVLAFAAQHGIGAFGSSKARSAGPALVAPHKKDDDAADPDATASAAKAVRGKSGGWELSSDAQEAASNPDEPFGFLQSQPLPRSYGVPPGFEGLLRTTEGSSEGLASEIEDIDVVAAADPLVAMWQRLVKVTTAAQSLLAGIDVVDNGIRSLSALKFVLAALAVFLTGCFVKFQPWDRDNTKIFYIFALVAAPFVGLAITFPVTHGISSLFAFAPAARGRAQAAGPHTHVIAHGGAPDSAPTVAAEEDDAAAPISRMDTGAAEKVQTRDFQSRAVGLLLLLIGLPAGVALFVFGGFSGAVSVIREQRMSHELYGPLEIEVGEFIRKNVPPKSVMLHDNNHRSPVGMLAGYPSLAGYDGWLWSHGYDYGERHNDRNYIMDRMGDPNEATIYPKMRRWGVRYVVGENKAMEEGKGPEKNLLHDSKTKRIFSNSRFQVLEVLGYDSPPS
ncbi:hypothetical protein FNF29_06697 [Cafeteria roenbergensis]|uniref:Uncharacterized protein n=1 Tax=Cafeteria roenbergensis TaxID=33653 RepID=A0A5A8C8W9_CAFRO|nr:hypothetical protein FNF29_06697 [Cafeteria roenbergensis]|eukprot:KAA0148480.1 hypothetical protein FNF29_06697 [Cafeteria roenbergensis]